MIVSDTTPLSAFLRIGKVELLFALFHEIHIPEAVAMELDRGQAVIGNWRRHLPRIHVHAVKIPQDIAGLLSNIDPGEAEAIALAAQQQAELLLIDDGKGRAAAQRLKVSILGSAGVTVRAKHKGLIPQIGPLLRDLRSGGGLWLSDRLIADLLAQNAE